MNVSFVLQQNTNNEYFFHFLDSNDEIVLFSDTYPDREAAEAAIKDVQTNSLISQFLAAGKTPNNEMFFVIKDKDGGVLVKSNLYTSNMKFDNALHCVKDNACIAETKDLTTSSEA